MKAILNIDKLPCVLSEETPLWQERVYSRTGVIPVFCPKNKSAVLFSNCGFIDLDWDAEYCSVSGEDQTEYCEIKSVSDLVEYILQMESYQEFLVDVPLGQFSKADLFWAVYSTIINPAENQLHKDGSVYSEWGLYSAHFYQKHLELNMAVIACDLADIWVDHDEKRSLRETLELIAKEMSRYSDVMEDIPQQQVFMERIKSKPATYAELKKELGPGGEFAWLC